VAREREEERERREGKGKKKRVSLSFYPFRHSFVPASGSSEGRGEEKGEKKEKYHHSSPLLLDNRMGEGKRLWNLTSSSRLLSLGMQTGEEKKKKKSLLSLSVSTRLILSFPSSFGLPDWGGKGKGRNGEKENIFLLFLGSRSEGGRKCLTVYLFPAFCLFFPLSSLPVCGARKKTEEGGKEKRTSVSLNSDLLCLGFHRTNIAGGSLGHLRVRMSWPRFFPAHLAGREGKEGERVVLFAPAI